MSGQLKYSTSRMKHPGANSKGLAKENVDKDERLRLMQSIGSAGLYTQTNLNSLLPVFAQTRYPNNDGSTMQWLVNLKDDRTDPAILGPNLEDMVINIRNGRDVPDGSRKSEAITDLTLFEGTSFTAPRDRLRLYLVPVTIPFGFQDNVMYGNMASPDVQQGMMDEHGEEWKDWCASLSESKSNSRDIATVLGKMGVAKINQIFPGNGSEYTIRYGTGATQPTPITEGSFPDECKMMEAFYTPVTASAMTTAITTGATAATGGQGGAGAISGATPTFTIVSDDSKKLKAKMKLAKNRFSATMMCGDINFRKGEIEGDIELPVLTDAYKECIQTDGDMSTAGEMMKIMLDTANKMDEPTLTRNVLSIYRRKRDHDPNLATSYCMGKFHVVPLGDLTLDTTKANIWAMGEETDDRLEQRKKDEDMEDAEETVGEETTNKTKKRIIINHVRTITTQEQLYKLLANHTHAQTACIKMKSRMTLYYRCEDHLISFLLEEDTMKWLEQNKLKQPQVFIWLVSVLDKLLAMLASAGSDHENLKAAGANDATKANKKTYDKAVARFCDYMDQWRKWVRNEVPMDVVPSVTPSHLRPGAKRQKFEEAPADPPQAPAQGNGQNKGKGMNQSMMQNMPYSLWQMLSGLGNRDNAGQYGQQQGLNQDRDADWKKSKGDFVVNDSRFRYVLAPGLSGPRCREWYALGRHCSRGNNCNHQHGTFKSWTAEDKAKQIAHVRINKAKLSFNGNVISVADIGQDNADLISYPNRGGGNPNRGGGNGGGHGRNQRGEARR